MFSSLYTKLPNLYESAGKHFFKYVWRYSREDQLLAYQSSMANSKNHLEIGTVSVWLPIMASKDLSSTRYCLLDIDQSAVISAKQHMINAGVPSNHIQSIQGDALQIDKLSLPNDQPFDSVAISYVLHCIPGSLNHKLPLILDGLSRLDSVNENTIFFGSTITYPDINDDASIEDKIGLHSMHLLQRVGIFNNGQDKHSDFDKIFSNYFNEYEIEKTGFVSSFCAKGLLKKNLW